MKYLEYFFKISAALFFIIIGCFVGYAIYGTLLDFLSGDLFSGSLFQSLIPLNISISAFIGVLIGAFTSLSIYLVILVIKDKNEKNSKPA